MKKVINIAVFASGTGSNFQNILDHFQHVDEIAVSCLVTNKEHCGAVSIANRHQTEVLVIDKDFKVNGNPLLNVLSERGIDWIVLAGFLKMIPKSVVHAYNDKIINIHPALLPKFGGKGMYGRNVHKAVLEAGEKESGITIHLVNEEYDKGEILFQATCDVTDADTVETLESKVRALEKEFYPKTIQNILTNEL